MDGVLARSVGEKEIERVLSELPAEIGMRVLAGPLIVQGDPVNPGWTGVVVIERSHISIHTFEEDDKASIDIFSCKPFEKEAAIRYLEKHIPFKKVNIRMLTRTEE